MEVDFSTGINVVSLSSKVGFDLETLCIGYISGKFRVQLPIILISLLSLPKIRYMGEDLRVSQKGCGEPLIILASL